MIDGLALLLFGLMGVTVLWAAFMCVQLVQFLWHMNSVTPKTLELRGLSHDTDDY